MKCSKCEKKIDNEKGEALVGMIIQIYSNESFGKEFVKKQMGPYKTGVSYNICWECTLNTFGVKPDVYEVPVDEDGNGI